MPETCGKRPLAPRQQRQPVLHRAPELGAGDLDDDDAVVERQLGQDVALGDARARLVGLAGADAAAVDDRGVGAHAGAHRVGEQVADRGLARAHRRG